MSPNVSALRASASTSSAIRRSPVSGVDARLARGRTRDSCSHASAGTRSTVTTSRSQTVEQGATALLVDHRLDEVGRRGAARRRRHPPCGRTCVGDRLGRSGAARDADRHHRHERQDDDGTDRLRSARSCGPADRHHRHAPRPPHDAGGARPARTLAGFVEAGRARRRDGGLVARPRAPPHRRDRVRRRRVHQLRSRPPRSARLARGVLPGQVGAVHVDVCSARRDQRRRHPGPPARRHDR